MQDVLACTYMRFRLTNTIKINIQPVHKSNTHSETKDEKCYYGNNFQRDCMTDVPHKLIEESMCSH